MVRSAKGACRPYELRRGGSAIAIACNTSSVIFMARGWKCEGAGSRWANLGGVARLFARAAARIPDLRLTHLDLLPLGLADLKGPATYVLCLKQFIVRQNFIS